MAVIYEPRGEAREGAPLAVNLYSGCGHGCRYCYAPLILRRKREEFVAQARPRPDILKSLAREAAWRQGDDREILLSLTSDPYQPAEAELGLTRRALEILIQSGLRFALLSKGGLRAKRDFDLLEAYPKCCFGVSLCFTRESDRAAWEPGAAPVSERIAVLEEARARGIETWVCLEPVIDPDQALKVIERLHGVADRWLVGKLNYRRPPRPVDWARFKKEAVGLLASLGAAYRLKQSLARL